ncbi:unnamed protein product, partial [Mesorhabditis belari]|uniref:Phosphotyrosine protein phosphatase I domain-containing protein n=1 Tax=Mesorhabditis belari TaxID=2138241 RepID=A0AAF3FCL9_9BILA
MGEKDKKYGVLFICLGNICRSPIAEAVFLDLLKKRNLTEKFLVDSAAVAGYHTGKRPESRTLKTLQKFGLTDYDHRAREVSTADFKKFDMIFGMDDSNISDLKELQRLAGDKSIARLEKFSDYDPQGTSEVPDPYYFSGTEMFDQVFQQCQRCCDGFLKTIENELMTSKSLVMYLVLRRDLLKEPLNWPIGAVATQTAHAASAAIWIYRDDPNVAEYTSKLDSMHKVTLGVDSPDELAQVIKKLEEKQLDHKVWIEDDMPVCVALKPYSKDEVKNVFRSLKLF